MSQIKAQLEALFGANKVRETPTGYRANADEVSMNGSTGSFILSWNNWVIN